MTTVRRISAFVNLRRTTTAIGLFAIAVTLISLRGYADGAPVRTPVRPLTRQASAIGALEVKELPKNVHSKPAVDPGNPGVSIAIPDEMVKAIYQRLKQKYRDLADSNQGQILFELAPAFTGDHIVNQNCHEFDCKSGHQGDNHIDHFHYSNIEIAITVSFVDILNQKTPIHTLKYISNTITNYLVVVYNDAGTYTCCNGVATQDQYVYAQAYWATGVAMKRTFEEYTGDGETDLAQQ